MAAPTPAFRHRTALIVSAVTALAFTLGTAPEAGATPSRTSPRSAPN